MRTIAVLNNKGGVGKTATADNLAVGLTYKGKRVLLVDFDPQANSTDIFIRKSDFRFVKFIDEKLKIENYSLDELAEDFEKELENEFDISKALLAPENGKEAIVSTNYDSLDLLPSSMMLANTDMEIKMNSTAPQHNRLSRILDSVKDEYDYVIVDCPPSTNVLTLNALIAADSVIIPIKIDRGAAKGFLNTVYNIYDIMQNFGKYIDVKILFTMVNRNNVDGKFIQLINKVCQGKVYKTEIRYQAKPISESSFNEQVVIDTKSNVAQDYLELIEEILEEGK